MQMFAFILLFIVGMAFAGKKDRKQSMKIAGYVMAAVGVLGLIVSYFMQ